MRRLQCGSMQEMGEMEDISMTPPTAPPGLLAERSAADALEPEPEALRPQPFLRSLTIEDPRSTLSSTTATLRGQGRQLSPRGYVSPHGSPQGSPYASPHTSPPAAAASETQRRGGGWDHAPADAYTSPHASPHTSPHVSPAAAASLAQGRRAGGRDRASAGAHLSPQSSPAGGSEAQARGGGWDRTTSDGFAFERVPNPLDGLSPEPRAVRGQPAGHTPPLRAAVDPEWADFPDLAIHVHGRELSKSELRRFIVGMASLVLLVVTVALMVVGRVAVPGRDPATPETPNPIIAGPSDADDTYVAEPLPSGRPSPPREGPAPVPAPSPIADSPAVLQGTIIVGSTARFNERRFRSDVAYVLGLEDSQIIVTSAESKGSFATQVDFDIFLPSTTEAQATRQRLVTYASTPGSPLLTAPSIQGTTAQPIQISLRAIPGNHPTEGARSQHDLQDGAGPMNDVDAGVDPAQHGSSITHAGGESGVIHVIGDASAVAFVNGHVVGSGQGADAARHALSFTAHCDETQVFAVSAYSAASMPSILAEIGHCGRTIVTNSAWKCAVEADIYRTNDFSSGSRPQWFEKDFDDTQWEWAVDGGMNGVQPWGPKVHISTHARWVWARTGQLQQQVDTVFCRYVWGRDVPPEMPVGGDNGQVHIAVANGYTLSVNGQLLGHDTSWTHTGAYTFLAPCTEPTVFAIEGFDTGGMASVLAEINHCGQTFVTGSNWKCSPVEYDGWDLPGFDDSEWPAAADGGANGVSPWGKRPQISGRARWIWTTDVAEDIQSVTRQIFDLPTRRPTVFCRWVEVNTPKFCPAAQRAYWNDHEDVRVNTLQTFSVAELCTCCDDCTCCSPGCETAGTCGYGNSTQNGGFRHFSEYGLREGRIWHSEMCNADGTDLVQQNCIGCQGQMHVTGVGDFEVSVNGFILASGQDWTRTHSLTFNASCWEPTVYAIRSVLSTATPTFIAEIDHCGSVIRTSEAWQCHNRSAPPEWTSPEFDSSTWPSAVDGGANGSPPWGSRPQISGQAHWVWRPEMNDTLLCRYTASADRWRDCPAASHQYTQEYPVVEEWLAQQRSPSTASSFAHFRSHGLRDGFIWRSDLCLANGIDLQEELARGRQTASSSAWSADTTSEQANDGNFISQFPHVFQSSNDDYQAWWRVELDMPTNNPLVRIHARDCCTAGFRHVLQIRIGTSQAFEDASVCATISERPGDLYAPTGMLDSGVFDARCMGYGRFVFVATEPDFQYIETPMAWQDASAACQAHSRELASVHTDSDIGIVTSVVSPGVAAWIGLNDLNPRQGVECGCDARCFTFSDGSTNDFNFWNPNEPNEYGLDGQSHCYDSTEHSGGHGHLENCVVVHAHGSLTLRDISNAPGYRPPYGHSTEQGIMRGSDTTCSFLFPFVCGPVARAQLDPDFNLLTMAEVEVYGAAEDCYECTGHIHIAADSAYSVYVNGREVGSGSQSTHTDTHTFYASCEDTTAYAVDISATGGSPSVILEIVHCGHTIRSDRSQGWHCQGRFSTTELADPDPAWSGPYYQEDTSRWKPPVDGGANGAGPWGIRRNLSPQARWMWSSDPLRDEDSIHRLKCRKTTNHAVPDCPSARARYLKDYPELQHSDPPFTQFINQGRPQGKLWHGELCLQQCGGAYIVALEANDAYVQQRVQSLKPGGMYRLRFLVSGGASPAEEPRHQNLYPALRVLVDGSIVWSGRRLSPTFQKVSAQFLAVSNEATIRFENSSPRTNTDSHVYPAATVFVDEVEANEFSSHAASQPANVNFDGDPQDPCTNGHRPIGWEYVRAKTVCNDNTAEWGGLMSGLTGSYVALVGEGASIQQTFAGLENGREYLVSIHAARHPDRNNQTLQIWMNDRYVGEIRDLSTVEYDSVHGQGFARYDIPFTATSPTVLVRFENGQDPGRSIDRQCQSGHFDSNNQHSGRRRRLSDGEIEFAPVLDQFYSLTSNQTCFYPRSSTVFVDDVSLAKIVVGTSAPIMNPGFEADDLDEWVCTQEWATRQCGYRYATPQAWEGSYDSAVIVSNDNAAWGSVNSATSPACIGWGPDDGNIHIAADNGFNFFVNGNLVGSAHDWRTTQSLMFNAPCETATVYAIEGFDEGLVNDIGGLIATLNHCGQTYQTDAQWRCSREEQHDLAWTRDAGFDDSHWQRATVHGTNSQFTAWRTLLQISPAARWIWTPDYTLDDHIYCRLKVHHQVSNCNLANRQYWIDYLDVQADDDYGVHVADGAYRHYRTIGRQQGRIWHSELCDLPQTVEFPTCGDPRGSISKDLRRIVGPGKYALCPGQAWVVPGFESYGAVTCFNEELCRAAGSDCAGLFGAGSEQVDPCDEHFNCVAYHWDAGQCVYETGWADYAGTASVAVSSESLQGQPGRDQSISSSIYPLDRLFTFSSKHPEHYQISLVLDPQAPLVAGISIMVRADYIGAGFSGIEIGTVTAGSGVVQQQVVRHEMFGTFGSLGAKWENVAPDFAFGTWVVFPFPRVVQNVAQIRLVLDWANRVGNTYGFSLNSIRIDTESVTQQPKHAECVLGTRALHLDGSSWVQLDSSRKLSPSDGDGMIYMTVEMWVNLEHVPQGDNVVFYEHCGETTGIRNWIGVQGLSGRVQCGVSDTHKNEASAAGYNLLAADTWYHFACVFAGSGYDSPQSDSEEMLYIFVNGELQDTATVPRWGSGALEDILPDGSSPVLLGASLAEGAYTARMEGQLAQFRIWDVPRNVNQIRDTMFIEIDRRTPHLIAYASFSGDSSGGGDDDDTISVVQHVPPRSPRNNSHAVGPIATLHASDIARELVSALSIRRACADVKSPGGCADGSREGFVEMSTYPGIAACEGTFEGFISSVSAKHLCSDGWHVCTGHEVQQREITVQEADAFPGAFAFDSANDCGNCHETCLGAMTGTSINGFCAVSATDYTDPDMECMGSGCTLRTGSPGTSCLLTGRTDAPNEPRRNGCSWYEDLTGVVCCIETGCADRTREGLTDSKRWPRIAACEGEWSGEVNGPSAAALCAEGWHVCSGEDVHSAGVTFAQATAFDGCFSFDAAHDCGNCHPTCIGATVGSELNGQCAESATDFSDPAMAGMGRGCSLQPDGTSCLESGRVNAQVGGDRNGCSHFDRLDGVVCCANQ